MGSSSMFFLTNKSNEIDYVSSITTKTNRERLGWMGKEQTYRWDGKQEKIEVTNGTLVCSSGKEKKEKLLSMFG